MYYCKQCIIINCVLISFVTCQNVDYDYTIEVPKFTCDNEQLKSGVTTIRLLGKDAQNLQYKFSVDFKSINMCKQSQRCTLMTWRAVRDLERHLEKVSASQKNLQEISINNTLLVPGIQYLLTVSVASNGNKVDDKEFILECANASGNNNINAPTNSSGSGLTNEATNNSISESATHSDESVDPSLILLGSNVTYHDMIYILNAEATDCDVNCSYYFKWEILDDTEKNVLKEPTKGSELQVAAALLAAPEQYTIKCSLIISQKGLMVATALQSVTVLRRGIVLKLAVSKLVVGPKQPFRLSAYLNDADNSEGKTNIRWLCTSDNRRQCSGFKTVNATTFESEGFPVLGRYNITITVSKGNIIKRDSCEVRVVVDGFARIDVDNINEPIDPSKEIEVFVYVSMLIASCTLQWSSVQTASYKQLDLQSVPGNINVLTNITLKEDEFLNEIDEFSNNTVDVDYNLKIPPKKGKWKGLEGNSSYLFRLNVTCPVAPDDDEEDGDDDSEPLLVQNYITLYADVPLHTDAPPILNALEVIPTQGIALKTLFKFTYQAKENHVDYPVLYKFGYFLNNETIFVANLLGVTNTKSVLPYVEKGVKTVLEGCNSHSLCAQIFGPIVITEIPFISEQDQNNLMRQLHEMMNREEYYKVFTYSLAILQTYSNINDVNLSVTMQNFISNLTSREIKRLLMLSADGDKTWRIPANDLMKNVGLLLNNFSASDILVNNVVALRNELSRSTLKLTLENTRYSSRKLLMVNQDQHRVKREVEKATIEEVRSYFVISELIITSSRDKKRVEQEKQSLINQIEKFIPGLCASLFEKSQPMNLELKTLILSVEKINKKSFNRYIHILYAENSWKVNGRIKLGRCFTDKLKSDQLCIGKVAFKNYFHKKSVVYMIKIYSAEESDQLDLQEDLACESVLVLPVDEKQIRGKEASCALWKKRWIQSQCKTMQVTSKTIQCSCDYLGYYSLQYDIPSSTTTAIVDIIHEDQIMTTTKTTSVELTIETPVTQITKESSTVSTLAIDSNTIPLSFKSTTMSFASIVNAISSEVVTLVATSETTTGSLELKEVTQKPIDLDVVQTEVFLIDEETSANTSLAAFNTESEDVTILYFIIGFSLTGIGILMYGIKHLLSKDEIVHPDNFPKYAILYHQEMLQDLPTST